MKSLLKGFKIRKNLEEQRMRNITNNDLNIARELYDDEVKKKKEEEEKENWERTMNLIKDEIKTDYDEEMAKVLREKEELERRLNQMQFSEDTVVRAPDYWSPQYNDYQIFQIQKNGSEWRSVTSAFSRSMSNQIIRIDRVQNKPLWSFYNLKKQVMDRNNGANEQHLFHGSKTNAYDLIVRDGFDHRVSNMTGMLGAGIYFATEANTSNSYVTRNNTNKRMLYCRVLVGSSGRGSSGLRRPPNKPNSNDLYDSVHRNYSIYALFDNHQAYPEYIINYR